MEQRFAFDQIANVYKAARPDYPEALIEDVVSYAGLRPNDKILEVGCGTGQATKSFAKRNFSILAIDPGPEMLRGARESLAGFSDVGFLETTFEAWPGKQGGFRLIVAAQSWHWVSAEVRFVRAAEVLSPEGSLAVFGHVPVGLPAPLLAQFREIYLRHTGQWGRPPEAWYLPDGPLAMGSIKEKQHLQTDVTLAPGKCYSIVGYSKKVKDLDLYLLLPPGVLSGQDLTDDNKPVIGGPPQPMCPVSATSVTYKLDIFADAGSGDVAVQLFSKGK